MDTSGAHIEGLPPLAGTLEGGRRHATQAPTQLDVRDATKPSRSGAAGDTSPESAGAAPQAPAKTLANPNRAIRLRFDEGAERIITKIVDRQTKEVIREIPSERLQRATQLFRDYVGKAFDIEG